MLGIKNYVEIVFVRVEWLTKQPQEMNESNSN